MADEKDLLAWVVLSRAPALDVSVLAAALANAGGAAQLLQAASRGIASKFLPAAAREYLRSPAAQPTDFERAWLARPQHHLIPFTDSRYPEQLGVIAHGPIALYVRGNAAALRDPQLAIVGSRNPTPTGRDNAFDFARYLAWQGLTITSGMACGIDAAAHRGALAAGAMTIAILGTGIDVVYPAGNGQLADSIAECGALVSEFPLRAPALRAHFPQRNRIIAALCLGTLVIEAASRSGSLITARLAGEQGREVFALPGSIHNPLARGCHQLIKQGAKLVENVDDILSELNFSRFPKGAPHSPKNAKSGFAGAEPMDKEHEILLDALGFEPADLDILVLRTGFKPEAVSSMLLILELEGHVQAAHGGRYFRVARSA